MVSIINSAKNIQRVNNKNGDWETDIIHLNSGSIISAEHVSASHEEGSLNIHLKDGSVLVEVPSNAIKTDKELEAETLPKGFNAAAILELGDQENNQSGYKTRGAPSRRRCCGG